MREDAGSVLDPIRDARIGLIVAHPYLASALVRLPLVDVTGADWCPTCATDGYAIYVNITFTSGLTRNELMFVLAHELVHCMVGHPDRRGDRDRFIWNIAADLATNLLLEVHGFDVPDCALLDHRFRASSAEEIYDLLLKDLPKLKIVGTSRTVDPGAVASVRVQTAGGSSLVLSREDGIRGTGLDHHLDPSDPDSDGNRPDPFPGEAERRSLRKELVEAASKAAGSVPGSWTTELVPATVRPVAWTALLANFVGGLRTSDYKLFPAHRKHIHRGLLLPSLGVPGPHHLAVAIDTSGSMPDPLLSEILAQVDHLRSASECTISLIQFDARIQAELQIDPWDALPTVELLNNKVIGRGGTDLRAPFNLVLDDPSGRFAALDALIIVTDGYGPVPKQPPSFPVLWLITHGGTNSCTFGAEIALPGG